MSVDSHILSMRTLFDPALAGDFAARVQLRLGEEDFRAEVVAGHFEIDRGHVDRPDATISTDPTTLIDVLHGRRELADVTVAGELEIEGDEAVAARFLQLCPLPSVPA